MRVVFIKKAGRTCHGPAKDYRPISLSSFFLKTLERLVDLHIRQSLSRNNISSSQHAYCKGKSTDTALHSIVGHIEDSILDKGFTLAAFVDIEGAFNNVTANSVIEAMGRKGIDMGLQNWTNHMLTSRIVSGEVAGACATRAVSRGTPQGGSSPLSCGFS